jgi:hypothetical protein
VLFEERLKPSNGNDVRLVIEVHMIGAADDHEFLRFRHCLVGVFAEVAGVRVLAGDQQDRARCDLFDISHQWHVDERQQRGAGQRSSS